MSYILVDKNGKVADFSSNGGMDELLAGPPSLLKFLEDGGSDDWTELVRDIKGTPFEYIAYLLQGMAAPVIISNGIEEDDGDEKDYHAEHDQSDHGNWADDNDNNRLKIGPNAPSKEKPVVMVFGGSFNPIHLGHVGATKDAIRMMREAGYDVKRAIIAPSAEKLLAKKLGDEAYSLAERVELAELTTRGLADIEVTGGPAIEAEHAEGKLRRTQLADWAKRRYPDATIVNITGADQATGPGHSPPGFPSLYAGDAGTNHAGYYYFALPRPEGGISSSKIRALIAKGEPIPSDVMHPDAVKRLPKKSRKFHLEGEHDQETHGNWADGSSGKTPEQQKKAKKAAVRGEVDAAAMAANVDEDALAEAFAVQHEDFNTEARFEVVGGVDEDAVREDLRDQARENIDRAELVQSLAESARENINEDDVREEIATETRDMIHKADGGSKDVDEDYRTENILKNAGLGEDATDAEKQDAIQAFIDEQVDDQLEDRINTMVDSEVEDNIEEEFDSAVDRYVNDNFDDALDRYRSNSDDQEITVHGKILDKNGNKAGDFTREIKLGERSVYHAYFFLGKDYQDKGIARDLLESSVRFYDQIGIDNVTVTANGDVGKYAWAVYGFDFDDSYTLHSKREGLLDKIKTDYELEWEQLGEAGRLALTNQIRSLKHSWDIATFKLGNEKVGKEYLLHDSDWSGRLDLNGDGRKIFDEYIKRSKSKPVEDKNQMKLPFAKKESEFGDQDSVIVHKDILDIEDEMYEIIAKLFPVEKYERHYEDIQFRRPLSKYESRVNFARANHAFTRLISETDVKLRDALRKAQKDIIKRATDAINILNPSIAGTFTIDVGDEFYRIFRDFLLDAWREGKDQAFDELPERVKAAARQVKQFHAEHDQEDHGNWADNESVNDIKWNARDALEEYSQLTHDEVNRYLRTGAGATKEAREIIRRLDKAFATKNAHHMFKKPTKVARVIDDANVVSKMAKLKSGATIEDKAFLSTSTDWKIIHRAAYNDYDSAVYMSITVPAGTKYLRPERRDEKEAILNRGTKLRIDKITKRDTVVEVSATVVGVKQFHYPGGEDHDQSTHGNWASGEQSDKVAFYSPLQRALEGAKQNSAPASDWIAIVSKGITKDELNATGVVEWLKGKGSEKVTKDDLLAFVKENVVQITPVVLAERHAGFADAKERLRQAGYFVGQDRGEWALFDDNLNKVDPQKLTDRQRSDYNIVLNDVSGSIDAPPKFAQYTLPGGENYREMLLTLPSMQTAEERALADFEAKMDAKYPRGDGQSWKDILTPDELGHMARLATAADNGRSSGFISGHFDQPNIVAHLRMDDRVDADGNKILFLEEIQSDWAQKGRETGFMPTSAEKDAAAAEIKLILAEKEKVLKEAEPFTSQGKDAPLEILDRFTALDDRQQVLGRIASNIRDLPPSAPFVTDTKSWVELSMKHAIAEAVRVGAAGIAWTSGEQQAERYDLSKTIRSIEWSTNGETTRIKARPIAGNETGIDQTISNSKLADLVGKDIAERINKSPRNPDGTGSGMLSGVELKVGGEGMKSFYDNIVPNVARKLIRKSDPRANIDKIKMLFSRLRGAAPDQPDNVTEQQGFYITPFMREQIRKGIALFDDDQYAVAYNDELYAREYHGDGSHDEKSHGNWATGGGESQQRGERGWAIDADTGELLAESDSGQSVEQNWQANVTLPLDKLKDRNIIIAHTHPEESSFSDSDWLNLVQSNVRSMQVVLPSGRVDTIYKPADYDWSRATMRKVRETWQAIEDDIFNSGRSLKMTVPQIVDEINQRLSKETGIVFTSELPLHKVAKEKLKKFHAEHDQSDHGNWAHGDITETENFKKWFGDSKVVDASGKPLVVYHGTDHDFDEFKTRIVEDDGSVTLREGEGVYYFSPREDYWQRIGGNLSKRKNTLAVYLAIKNPAVLTRTKMDELMFGAKPDRFPEDAKFIADLKAKGHDGAVSNDGVEWAAFYPEQIKSVKNKGSFNPADKRISYAGFEPRQAIDYLTTKALVIKGLLDNELTEDFRQLLLEHLKGGRTLSETIMDLRELFEPWIGDPTKIAPSGQIGINTPPGTKSPDNLLQAYRLENMIRTPIVEAYNQGRLAIGDAADDYVIGYEYSALLDTRTTEICQANDGLIIRKDDPRLIKLTPPVHYQCRSLLVYVTIDDTPVEWSDDEDLDAAVERIQDGFA